jgi:hypothetical protein
MLEHLVVVAPDDPDGEKADDEGDVVRPFVPERRGEATGPHVVDAEVENEQRHGHGEYAVAEGLRTVGGHRLRPARSG